MKLLHRKGEDSLKKIVILFSLLIFVLTFLIPFTPSVSAEAGTWYSENAKFYEQKNPEFPQQTETAPKSYIELLKKYDEQGSTIEPGMFDVNGHVYKMVIDASTSAINWVKKIMLKFVIEPEKITQDTIYNKYKDGVKTVAITALAIFIMFNMVKIVTYRIGDSSDGAIVMNEKIMNMVVIGIFLFVYDKIIYWILQAQSAIIHGIVDKGIDTETIAKTITGNLLMGPGHFSFLVIIFLAILLVIITMQFYYRIALIGILYMFGPIAIATKLNDTYNFFDFWLKTIVSSFLTLILQVAAVAVGIEKVYFKPDYYGDVDQFFTGIAMFVVAMVLPNILGQWGMSTGATRALSAGAKTAVKVLTVRR